MPKYWFTTKRFGWGWVPNTWQGWLTIGIYFLVIFLAAQILKVKSQPSLFNLTSFEAVVILATSSLIAICAAKGPWPKWRWGK